MPLDPERQLEGLPPQTANEMLFDAQLRHQIFLLRISAGFRNEAVKLLNDTEEALAARIRDAFRRFNNTGRTTESLRRLQDLQRFIMSTRKVAWDGIEQMLLEAGRDLVGREISSIDGIVKQVVPVQLETNRPNVRQMRALINDTPFQGRTLRQWVRKMFDTDVENIVTAMRTGIVQGMTSDQIARSVVGNARLRGRDGVTRKARQDAATLTRTYTNHIGNTVRREYFEENSDLFQEELYVATLDSRTSKQCRGLDGNTYPVGQGPIPPIHLNCRSIRVVILNGQVLGNRPAKPFVERQLLREFIQKNNLGKIGKGGRLPFGSRDRLPRGFKGKYDQFRRRRIRELTGSVPAKISYEEWFRSQPIQFQRDDLGPVAFKLFRRGGLTFKQLVNQSTQLPFNQADLARQHAKVFRQVGLDPADFLANAA